MKQLPQWVYAQIVVIISQKYNPYKVLWILKHAKTTVAIIALLMLTIAYHKKIFEFLTRFMKKNKVSESDWNQAMNIVIIINNHYDYFKPTGHDEADKAYANKELKKLLNE